MLHIVSTNFMAFALLLMLQLIFIVHCTWQMHGPSKSYPLLWLLPGFGRSHITMPICHPSEPNRPSFDQVIPFSVMQLFGLGNFP